MSHPAVVPVDSPETFQALMADVRALASDRQWEAATARALDLAAMAWRLNTPLALIEAGRCLQRLELFHRAWPLYVASERDEWLTGRAPAWDGGDLGGRTLVIRSTANPVGDVIRFARLIGHVAARARRCIALVDARLVPLLARTFDGVEFAVQGRDDDAALAAADVVASFELLCLHLACDWPSIARTFRPLRPDSALVAQFRRRYLDGHAPPLIGVSWMSTNVAKDLPSLDHWADFMDRSSGTFVSLQYGETNDAVELLRARVGNRLVSDRSVDSLADLDRYAAQIATLDFVITVPSTCAHMAGALDIPTVVLLDDRFHLSWPQRRPESPWYPRTILMRKRRPSWASVFEAGRHRLTSLNATAASKTTPAE